MKVIVGFKSLDEFELIYTRYHGYWSYFAQELPDDVSVAAILSERRDDCPYITDSWLECFESGDELVLAKDELHDRHYYKGNFRTVLKEMEDAVEGKHMLFPESDVTVTRVGNVITYDMHIEVDMSYLEGYEL